ncbi:MAG: HAD hydrolase family protein [Rhodospirillales bacterium]|nr:HAD hydrolase family protein [Rhodospirillales bacterium]
MGLPKLSKDALIEKLKSIKLFSLDVDGTLTDGGLYYMEDGTEYRRFNVRDGMGIKLSQKAGMEFAIVTASFTPSITHRAERLGIEHLHLKVEDKVISIGEICAEKGWSMDHVAHIGDDVNDLGILEVVGLPLCPADAIDSVKEKSAYICENKGGMGAVREICDLILISRGQ